MFWLFAVALTIVAVILGFAPLWRRKPDAVSHADHDFDLTVYRNQLSELDADHARGVVSGAEYEQARVEVARRIVAAEDAVTKAQAASSGAANNRFVLPAFALLFVPVLSGLFYVELGSPGLDAQPLAARLNAVDPDGPSEEIRLLVERAEEHLRVNPSDVRGWDVLGP
ncbi:MAG: c-type cytochrome biogenesis protein CcmI, partial [Pseudomonadota bacterium]